MDPTYLSYTNRYMYIHRLDAVQVGMFHEHTPTGIPVPTSSTEFLTNALSVAGSVECGTRGPSITTPA